LFSLDTLVVEDEPVAHYGTTSSVACHGSALYEVS